MPDYRDNVLKYIRVSEAILESGELTDTEKEAVWVMVTCLSEMVQRF